MTTQTMLRPQADGLPARGEAKIDSSNRTAVRKWLTAQGLPYSAVANLTIPELSSLYNDTSDAPLLALLAENGIGGDQAADKAPAPQPDGTFPAPVGAPAMLPADKAKAAAELVAILTANQAQPIDREEVRRIVREEAGLQPIRVTVTTPHNGTVDVGTCHKQFPKLLQMVGAGLNVWLAGPAGTGKTTAAEQVAKALGRPFRFNGAIASEHKLLGFIDAQGRIVSRPFREAFINGGVYLFDEVDASMPDALLAFNAALANGHCDFPDGCHERHPDFVAIAAANTWGHGATTAYVGRAKMDDAFRDRFVDLAWDIDKALETALALACIEDRRQGEKWIERVRTLRSQVAIKGARVTISPRASIHGCKLLQAGMGWDDVETATVRRGMTDETWKALNA